MLKNVLGRLGWTPSDFWGATLKEVFTALEGHTEAQREQDLQEWKRTRLLAFFVLQPYSQKLKEPKDLFLLDDEKVELPQMDPERMKQLFSRWDEQVKRENNARKNSGS